MAAHVRAGEVAVGTDVRVERAAAVEVLAPGDRVVGQGLHRPAAVGVLVDRGEHVREAADVGLEVVEAVAAGPVLGQRLARLVHAVGDLDGGVGRVHGGAVGAGAEHLGEVAPLRLGLDRRADREQAAAVLEVGLERRFLRRAQRCADVTHQDDRAELLERVGREDRRVARAGDCEAAVGGERLEGVDTGAGRAEGEHVELRALAGLGATAAAWVSCPAPASRSPPPSASGWPQAQASPSARAPQPVRQTP